MLTGILFLSAEELLDLVANFTIRDLDIVLGCAIIRHQRKEAVLGNVELIPNQFGAVSALLQFKGNSQAGIPYG